MHKADYKGDYSYTLLEHRCIKLTTLTHFWTTYASWLPLARPLLRTMRFEMERNSCQFAWQPLARILLRTIRSEMEKIATHNLTTFTHCWTIDA